MAGIISLFFTWPAQCCGSRAAPEPAKREQAPVDRTLLFQHSSIWAVMRLVPEMKFKQGTEFSAVGWGGKTGAAHKVTLRENPTTAYFVKVGSFSPKLWLMLREASSAGLTPKVIGADDQATVQEFCTASPFPLWGELLTLPEEERLAKAAQIGRLTAKMHKLPLPPGATANYGPAKRFWADLPRQFMKFRAVDVKLPAQLQKVHEYVSSRPPTAGVGGKAGGSVFTHGDWRAMNVLMAESGDVLLCDVDEEKFSASDRAGDLACFLWLWDFHDDEDTDYLNGTGSYPPLPARRALAEAYLSEAGLPADRDAVDELLWEVEYYSLTNVLGWIPVVGMRCDRFDWKRTIAFAEAVLSTALSGNKALRDSIVEFGLMNGAHQRKFGEHFAEADGSSELRSQI